MKLSRFYELAIEFGSRFDPGSRKQMKKIYSDSAILYGDPDTSINKIMVGIDIEIGELLLAERIKEKECLDMVVSHHPEGAALARLFGVMDVQVELLVNAGMNRNVAAGFLEERIREVQRKLLPNNHSRPVDAARLLGIPFMCLHTPADNHAAQFLKNLFTKKKPDKVRDILEILNGISEYRSAAALSCGPKIILGNPGRKVGKIFLEMTGGTEGPKDIFDKLYNLGVRTLVSMHLSEEHFKKAKDANLNVVIAGHISSDTLGLNLLLDRIEQAAGHEFQVINCSGFNRVRR